VVRCNCGSSLTLRLKINALISNSELKQGEPGLYEGVEGIELAILTQKWQGIRNGADNAHADQGKCIGYCRVHHSKA